MAGLPGEVERQRIGVPGPAHGIDRPAVDLDRIEEVVVDGQRRSGKRRRRDDVGLLEPALHLPVQPGAHEDRPIQLLSRVACRPLELRDQARIHHGPMLLEMAAELGKAVGAVQGQPELLGMLEVVRHLDDLRAQLREGLQRPFAQGAHLRCDNRIAEQRPPGDLQSLQVALPRARLRPARCRGRFALCGSLGCGPAIASSINAVSMTVRAIGVT